MKTPPLPLAPGQVIGIYGGGQLGRMLALAALRWGYRVHVYTDSADSPAAVVAHECFVGSDQDEIQFRRFAESIDVLTFEFENVSAESLRWVPVETPIRPGPGVFWTCQNRGREKAFLAEHALPLPAFWLVTDSASCQAAIEQGTFPAVLKTAAGGYDGKGQVRVESAVELAAAWEQLGRRAATLEAFVDLAAEISVVVARDVYGQMATYGPFENRHVRHILDLAVAPARVAPQTSARACELAEIIASKFELVGLICVEFFVTREGQVLVNEIAPRTHNSGHLTIEAFNVSQFEQQLRCVAGWPVAPVEQVRPAAMVNLLGDLWRHGPPRWETLGTCPDTYLHLYGKEHAAPGRKMGHLTCCADSVTAAIQRAEEGRANLMADPPNS